MALISAIASLLNKRALGILAFVLMTGAPVRAASPLRVVAVESPNLASPDLVVVQKALGIAVGRHLDPNLIDEGIRSLHGSGEYQSVIVETLPEGKGLRVRLRGTKLKRLRNMTFTGVESDILDDTRRRLNLEEGETTDSRTFSVLKDALKEELEERGYYFAKIDIKVTDVPGTREADLEIVVDKGFQTSVAKVNIIGSAKDETANLKSLIAIKRGGAYSKAALDTSVDAINKYFKNNQYPTSKVDSTNLNFSEDKREVEVNILVKMGEKYRFQFVGNTVFSDIDLRDLLTEEILSQPDASSKVVEQLTKKYRSVGYHFCKVVVKNVLSDVDKLNIVRFEIEEGSKVIIDRTEFRILGGEIEDSVESLFYETAPGVLGRKIYWEEGMDEALRNLRASLEARGFLNPALGVPKTIFSEDGKGVQLLFDIDLGTRTYIAQANFQGVSQVSQKELEELSQFQVGEPFNRDRVRETRRKIVEYYQSRGYADVLVAEEEGNDGVTLSPDRKRATVNFKINEGRQYFVGQIRVQGAKKTKDIVVLREMKLDPGDVYDPALVRKSEDEIQLLGLFSRAEIVASNAPDGSNHKDLTVVVRENKPGLGELGLGGLYEDPRLRLITFSGIAYRNLMGLNHTATARAEVRLPITTEKEVIPFIEYAALLGYRAPYPFSLPFTYSTQISLDSFEVSPVGPKLQTRARIENKVERKLSSTLTANYKLHRYERTNTEILALTGGAASSEVERIGSTGPGVIVDFRNDIFNPTKGSLHTLDVEIAHPSILSDDDIGFMMMVCRNSFYVPLPGPFSLSFFGGIGYARSIIGTPLPKARLVNDLSLGGQTSIRGYAPRRFSPAPDDNSPITITQTAYYNARSELTIYLFSNISAALFLDTGQIFPDMRTRSGDDGKSARHDGVGFGIRYKTPVGPIVIDIAQGLGTEKESLKFYFTVGTF